jgi:membrane associated rhomboid family serine protease
MNQNRTFVEEIKFQYHHGGMHIRLIIINTIIFILIGLGLVIANLSQNIAIAEFLGAAFTLETNLKAFATHPWGLITSIFAHFEFFHFFVNMLFLYFAGSMFIQFFTSRRLLHVYVLGGIIGGLLEITAHNLFPALIGTSSVIVGASGSIMAIFIAMAFYRPNIQVSLFGVIPVRLIIIAGLYLLYDIVSLGSKDATAHFAHLGGALIGFLSVQQLHSSKNIINMSESFGQKIMRFFSNLFKPKTKMKVEKGGVRMGKSDEQYALEKKQRQEKTDKILDKISKSGYESLTKAEKDFLFSQSNNG